MKNKDFIIIPEGSKCPYYKQCPYSYYNNNFLKCWGTFKYRGSLLYTCNLKMLRQNAKNNKKNK